MSLPNHRPWRSIIMTIVLTGCLDTKPVATDSAKSASGAVYVSEADAAAGPESVTQLHARAPHGCRSPEACADLAALSASVDHLKSHQDGAAKDIRAQAQDIQHLVGLLRALQMVVDHQGHTVVTQGEIISDLQAKLAAPAAEPAPVPGPPTVVAQPVNMVRVGDVWVDKYETSIWGRFDGKPLDCSDLQQAVSAALEAGATPDTMYLGADGPFCKVSKNAAICAYRQYGSPPGSQDDLNCTDYPMTFPPSGYVTAPLFACPIAGVRPSVCTTWFQAAAACTAAGKHLTTNAEWQVAVSGTYDPGPALGSGGDCNMASGKVRPTGQGSKCKSAWGVEDMVGNVDEWVADWTVAGQSTMTGKEASATPWPNYGDGSDMVSNLNGTSFTNDGFLWRNGLPSAAFRGGHHNVGKGGGPYSMNFRNGVSDWGVIHGQRCAMRAAL